MSKKFYVLALGEFIHQEGINVALEAFADLFHDVTSKHQKQMKLLMVTKGTLNPYICKKVQELQIEIAVQMIPWSEQEAIEKWYEAASIMLLPSTENPSKLISEAFSFSLPVVCYERAELEETINPACGIMLERGTFQQNIFNYSEVLRMLYFDPEARKIMKRGARRQYENLFSWGYSQAS